MSTHSPSQLNVLDAEFRKLAKSDLTLGLDGTDVHPDLPQRWIGVTELRSVLLHPSTSFAARDAAFEEMVRRAQTSERWSIAVIGMLMFGLKRAAGRLTRSMPELGEDIDAELIAGVVEALHDRVGHSRVAAKLITAAIRRARSLVENAHEQEALSEMEIETPPSTAPVQEVLDRAVATGAITEDEAELIADTRLYGQRLSEAARSERVLVDTIRHRRNRAEARLRAFIEAR